MNQFSDNLGIQSNEVDNSLSEKTPTLPTTSLSVNKTSDPSIVMCQILHEYLELEKIEPSSKKSNCMRRKLRVQGLENQPECNKNPKKPENAIFDIKNFPTNKVIKFAENLCDISRIKNFLNFQLKTPVNILRYILKPEQFRCLQYKLHELKPDSPLVKNYNSSVSISILIYCRDFLERFQFDVIDAIVKADLDLFDELNISGCMKINIIEIDTTKAYEFGIIAIRSPDDEILAEIKAKYLNIEQSLHENILNCYLKYFYGN